MKVNWSKQALNEFIRVTDYIQTHFGSKTRRDFVKTVKNINRLLGQQPNMGQVEQLLEDSVVPYRSIAINHLNRIVYYISENNVVEVADFWDMRRSPETLSERLS